MRRALMMTVVWGVCRLAAAEAPTAEAILDRYVEVTGGKAAYANLKSQSAKGKMEFAGQGITGALTMMAADGRSLLTLDLGAIGSMKTGTGDGVAWQVSPMQGARLMEGEEKLQSMRAAQLDAPARWRELYQDVKAKGEDTVDGRACLLVESKLKGASQPETNCYDKESGLLLRSRSVASSAMGDIAIESLMKDYRKAGGILMPFRIEQKAGPQTLIMSFEEVSVNTTIAPETFAPPAEVQALIAKSK